MVYKTYCISKQNSLYDEEEEMTKKKQVYFYAKCFGLKTKTTKKTIEIK